MSKQKEKIRDAKKYDKFDYKVGSKSELLSFAVAFVVFLISFIPVLAAFPRDILRLICAVLSSYPFIIDAFYGIKAKKIKKSLLIISIIILAMFIGRFDQCAAAAVLFRVYDFFEKFALNRSRAGIDRAASLVTDTAHAVRPEGGFEIIDPAAVVPGMKLAALAGETIPVDGIVTEGFSTLDYSLLTGEPVPKKVVAGDKILSGAVNGNSVIYFESLCSQADSVASRIADTVRASCDKKTAALFKIKKYSKFFTFSGIIIAVLVGVIGSAVTKYPFEWLHRALTVLACVSPSVFISGIVLSENSAIGSGARIGIIFGSGNVFEKIRKTSGIVFEGDSLLLNEKKVTGDVFCSEGYDSAAVLNIAAKCYLGCSNSVAKAIKATAGEIDSEGVSDFKNLENGVCAVLPEGRAVCGDIELMKSIGADIYCIPDSDIYVCLEGKIIGGVELRREIKKSAVSAVSVLRNNGIDKIYCYSDSDKCAAADLSSVIGTDGFVHGEEDGKSLLSGINSEGKSVFVADVKGNRSLLSRADVSVLCGDEAVRESLNSDITVMQEEPMRIVDAMMLASKAADIMRMNILCAVFLKVLVAVLGIFGIVPMFVSVIADITSLIICYINILRINKQR